MSIRHYSLLDRIVMQVDAGFAALFSDLISQRPNPGDSMEISQLTEKEKRQAAGLMRVNHSGEVCAQALYNAQMLVAHSEGVYNTLKQAGMEETDHLAWTHQRLKDLESHRSYLNVFWYMNSFLIGALAGLAGDRWSLGFVEETERQVSKHLEGHLGKLPEHDHQSRAVVAQMKIDEEHHGQSAADAGAHELPRVVKNLMSLHAKVMTTLAYWV